MRNKDKIRFNISITARQKKEWKKAAELSRKRKNIGSYTLSEWIRDTLDGQAMVEQGYGLVGAIEILDKEKEDNIQRDLKYPGKR